MRKHGSMDREKDWEPGDVGYVPDSATDLLDDLGQVTVPPVPVSLSLKWGLYTLLKVA